MFQINNLSLNNIVRPLCANLFREVAQLVERILSAKFKSETQNQMNNKGFSEMDLLQFVH